MSTQTFDLIPAGPDMRALIDPASGEVLRLEDRQGRPFDPLTFDPLAALRAQALARMAWASTRDE